MKKSKLIIFSVAVVVMCSQCNLFNKAAVPVEFVGEESVVLPQDRESVVVGNVVDDYADKELLKGVVTGDWAIETVFEKNAKGEVPPFIKFDDKTMSIYGNNGCNVINGEYAYSSADSTLTFSNVITTMRNCSETDITDYDINSALNMTRYYSWKSENMNYYLYLYDKNKVLMMTLKHQNFDFLNGSWLVVAINDEEQDNSEMKLVFDIDEMKLHGNTGCNVLNGTIATDMETANSISFQQIATTRRMCPDATSETELLVALEDVVYVQPIDNSSVKLLDSNRKTVLELKRD